MIQIEHFQILDSDYEFKFTHSSGPGGQNVNKLETKAILIWRVVQSQVFPDDVKQRFCQQFKSRIQNDGCIQIASDKFRSQQRNVHECKARLVAMITQVLHPPKKRQPTKPSRGSIERRIQNKKRRGDTKRNRQGVDH